MVLGVDGQGGFVFVRGEGIFKAILRAMKVTRLYKFRELGKDWRADYALDALFSSTAIFSGRKNFNDLFDSKIELQKPTVGEVAALLDDPRVGGLEYADKVKAWVSGSAFTFDGNSILRQLAVDLNKQLDRYPIYCLSGRKDHPLMWAHYAGSHTGFCIEFEFPDEQPKPVVYREHIETIPLVECLRSAFGLLGGATPEQLGSRIIDALLVKMDYWAYEEEYRWIAGNEMGQHRDDEMFSKRPYPADWVKAIIFGCRMPSGLKQYIIRRLPFATHFEQAIEAKDWIEVVPFQKDKHL